jgi:hypothetical protein
MGIEEELDVLRDIANSLLNNTIVDPSFETVV